jgi:small-conductance mechanosensitive channel
MIRTTMKRLILFLILACTFAVQSHAVLKEQDLERTLGVLRQELTERYLEMSSQTQEQRRQNKLIQNQLMETMKRSNQNSLMLYSQNNNYVFDLTYACHEATEQYQEFQKQQLPFKQFLESHQAEIVKYDSLILSLRQMPLMMLSQKARTDRNVCLTLAVNIRNTLEASRAQTADYINYYKMSEQRLKNLNDYAQDRYNEIQRGIFMNGSYNYFTVLRNIPDYFQEMVDVLQEKYRSTPTSQWDSRIIFGLFAIIFFYVIVATLINLTVFRFLIPRRFRTEEFMKKRTCIIMATTTITFAVILAVLRNVGNQNFFVMASDLLIEYAWLLSVILISLLLRVNGSQISSAFRIYSPLVLIGFLVIAFRIILIPKELVNLFFPPILLLVTIWQWSVINRHNKNVPQQDMFYTYISLAVLLGALVCSWMGYTLLSVQILIWWIMQLTCILTITCLSQWMNLYSQRKEMDKKAITKTWHYHFVAHVVLPVLAVLSLMVSIYWAADVFNLSDLCWKVFKEPFVDMENLQLSIVKLSLVTCLWFLFRYISTTLLSFLELHFHVSDPSTAASRSVMSRNVIQVLVWGIWLLLSLGILHISLAWLLAISGGLSTGIGFASKNIIENIFYGASLMAGRLKVGDWIDVDGIVGKVQQISYTSTVVESLAGEIITFQNSQLFDKNYKNLTKNHGYVVVPVVFGVAYGSNLKQVQNLVDNAVNSLDNPWVDPMKEAHAIVINMNDSSVDFKIVVWAEVAKRAAVASEVLTCIYDTLNANGIEIPFPQRDIHIIK